MKRAGLSRLRVAGTMALGMAASSDNRGGVSANSCQPFLTTLKLVQGRAYYSSCCTHLCFEDLHQWSSHRLGFFNSHDDSLTGRYSVHRAEAEAYPRG